MSQVSTLREHVGWGPVWAGVTVAVATYLFLQMAFFALGLLELGPALAELNRPAPSPSLYLISGFAGAVAFLVGGFSAGATAAWRGVGGGAIHGLTMWTMAVLVIVALSLVGAGTLFGALSDALSRVVTVRSALDAGNIPVTAGALEGMRAAAGWASVTLVALLGCAVAGALAGVRAWPRNEDDG